MAKTREFFKCFRSQHCNKPEPMQESLAKLVMSNLQNGCPKQKVHINTFNQIRGSTESSKWMSNVELKQRHYRSKSKANQRQTNPNTFNQINKTMQTKLQVRSQTQIRTNSEQKQMEIKGKLGRNQTYKNPKKIIQNRKEGRIINQFRKEPNQR